jgi:hypothetical protein
VNGRIDIVETEIERVEPGFEIDGDPRIGREKGWQSGREPAGAERGQDGKGQRSAVGIGAKAQCGAEIRRKASRMSRAGFACNGQLHSVCDGTAARPAWFRARGSGG